MATVKLALLEGGRPVEPAPDYRRDAARRLQLLVARHLASGEPVGDAEAIELVDYFTLAAIQGLERYLMEPPHVA